MKNKFKKVFFLLVAIVLAVCGIGNIIPQEFAVADETVTTEYSKKVYLASNSTNIANRVNFTPLKRENGKYTGVRESGVSFKPTLTDNGNLKYIAPQLKKFDEPLFEGDIKAEEIAGYGIKVWIYFDANIKNAGSCYNLELGFICSTDSSKKVIFSLNSDELDEILTKETSISSEENEYNYDSAFNRNSIPYGWNLVSLPFSKLVGLDNIKKSVTIDDATIDIYSLSELDSFYISQDRNFIKQASIYVYSIELSNAGYTSESNIVALEKQPFVYVNKKVSSLQEFADGAYYVGEYYNLPKVQNVFNSLWFGEKNLLDSEYNTSDYFRITVSKNGASAKTYYFWDDTADESAQNRMSFKLESGQYVIKFMFGDSAYGEATVGVATLVPQDYGTGVWFTINSLNLKVGETYSVNYKVHNAFADQTFRPVFKSTNEQVLKIVKIDYVNQQVLIEAVGEGEANIEITVYDDRLNSYRTDYVDGIKNTNFSIKVTNPESNVDVVAILLYITAGLMVVYFGYLLYKAIKNRNNYEVR